MFENGITTGDPVALGEGPMANSMQGGHIAIVERIPFPRWVVAIESTTADGPRSGVVVDLQHRSVGRWFLVKPGDALISAASCGMRMGDKHLCIPTIYRLDGGHLEHQLQLEMIAPIVDHLASWWEHRDGPAPSPRRETGMEGVDSEVDPDSGMEDPDSPVLDRRAFSLLGELHGGATCKETNDGIWIVSDNEDDPRDDNKDGDREYAGSAGYQLVHWGLASWDDYPRLCVTPAGRALANSHGLPAGSAKGRWSNEIEIGGAAPDVLIVDQEIDEPRELEIPYTGTLKIDRKHDGWGANSGNVHIVFDPLDEPVIMDISVARALVEQLALPLVKGPTSRVRLQAPDRVRGRKANAVAEIGGGEVVIAVTTGRSGPGHDIRLDVTKSRVFRAILKEAVKKNGEGGAMEDVDMVKTTPHAIYGVVDWD